MLEILKTLDERHYTNTKSLLQVEVRCSHCGAIQTFIKQNALKHNREKRTHCPLCVGEKYHRLTGTRIHRIWSGLLARCKGTSHERDRRNYSDRGIAVCERWNSFENFFEDMRESYSDDLTIERIDTNGLYCKENCRWATHLEQQANKRNNRVIFYQGETMHLAEYCRRTKVSRGKITAYLNRGLTGDQAEEAARQSTYNRGRPRKARSSTW